MLCYETREWHCAFDARSPGDKADLAEIGRAKHAENGGDKVSEQTTSGVIKNDNAAPKHNTQKTIAEKANQLVWNLLSKKVVAIDKFNYL